MTGVYQQHILKQKHIITAVNIFYSLSNLYILFYNRGQWDPVDLLDRPEKQEVM